MLYNTGTIAISGNTLTGTGTNFTAAVSIIRTGCTVIAMTRRGQVIPISTIG
ncbi:phage tail protein, partial [Enterobacter hormaechei]